MAQATEIIEIATRQDQAMRTIKEWIARMNVGASEEEHEIDLYRHSIAKLHGSRNNLIHAINDAVAEMKAADEAAAEAGIPIVFGESTKTQMNEALRIARTWLDADKARQAVR